ncbi:hypothetical protein DSS3P1_12 [Ruegeria phage DSS3-P1]|uniref:hypothetical protein n=1 Tax=Ruegeria phage DSS3-P1 TaxID=1555208 RepID=UPI0002357D89|nr:hypothetical protein DSS3P1_12 [Ruegeria phage DSS3-P1]YP_009997228.1 hypothetical protein JT312_gp11 [Ruegeria phage vB_RpoS-V18]YP_009997310.1 hypothetical protein JT313_gp11 [Ruegeria phage vB_RpoS-V11]YP_009997393.1 hypothetical protein JT314_gp12 [Ruegeria phage vB_RpoS-V7]AET42325.1 hypothetical protein SDSG_00060 [Ruegeria phage DSS3-P1]AIT13247.1 hypothetical protein DSS3P1_12 [Ruegeria phage DSS3-P1]AWY08715.1 hypothetical protein vBRpoSV7_12 [Ruegeria phage vB_RpoS-V7]AWY08887.1
MPEFCLDLGDLETHRVFDALPDFTRGYIEAAFFCGVDLPDGDRDESDSFGLDDLSADSLAEMAGDCAGFMAAHAADLDALNGGGRGGDYDHESAGRDYWFTRNGHGVGFWDRGFTGEAGEAAARLSDACRYNESSLWADDSGAVHVEPCGGHVDAGRAIIETAKADRDALPVVGGRYGAPMGRRGDSVDPDAGGALTARRVTLDAGGYDAGGAYWGLGAPLWRVTDPNGATQFVRAANPAAAVAAVVAF